MPAISAPDGTSLAYHVLGGGTPLLCLPGGPMQAATYLGDLGGLHERLQLILPDLRGTGQSDVPGDPSSYRCDRLVDDVEAIRQHRELDRMNLLAHSAGANLAVLYAARYPEHVDKLVLVTPSTIALGIHATVDDRRDVVRLRQGEPWFERASAAFERINAGHLAPGDVAALAPLKYGRWDAQAQEHEAAADGQRNQEAAAEFAAEGAFHPEATRTALSTLPAPVLLIAGELDVNSPPNVVARLGASFPRSTLVIMPTAGHFPWLDDSRAFTEAIASFVA
jgi:pimeloyl-ACP methyl ester carboxylesterase